MGTSFLLVCLPGSPSETREPSLVVNVPDFALRAPGSSAETRTGDARDRYFAQLGLFLFGIQGNRAPWIVYAPDELARNRDLLDGAWVAAQPELKSDEMLDWWQMIHGEVMRALDHAIANGEHLVAMFEGSIHCFRGRKLPRYGPHDYALEPTCVDDPNAGAAPSERLGWLETATAIAMLLVGGLALFRHARFNQKRRGDSTDRDRA